MSNIFNFDQLKDHELYHLRYGKGAVIIAIPDEDPEESQTEWEDIENKCYEKAHKRVKTLRQKKIELEKELSSINGGIRNYKQPASDDEIRIKKQIESLNCEEKSQRYIRKSFFTNMQLAMFYSHNVSPSSEVHTRFDRIINIEELGHHVKIHLQFSDSACTYHNYHSKIRDSYPATADRPYDRWGGTVEGVTRRIVPIEHVTLEVITRPEQASVARMK